MAKVKRGGLTVRETMLRKTVLTALVIGCLALPARAQQPGGDAEAELAKKLANPVASLISVPLQFNYDTDFGPDDEGSRAVLNVQPVWPFSLGVKWNLITRTIVPVVSQSEIPPGTDESGLGDITQSFFLSPKAPVGGWILAAGPVLVYPSATDEVLGGKKWCAGPTALALTQTGPWTVGLLANHLWSFAGDDERADLSVTFTQPFVSYITKTKTTLGLSSESTYDWENEQWSVPVIFSVSQLLKIGPLPVSLGAGVRYWADSPDNGPEGVGFRGVVTFLFPK